MPDQPSWIDRVTQIRESLERAGSPPFLDRSAIEALFGVRRRQAVNLMHRFAGFRVGSAFLVRSDAVSAWLRRLEESGSVTRAVERKARVTEFLAVARARGRAPGIAIPDLPSDWQRRFADLSPAVRLEPGLLTIAYDTPGDLLRKLYELGQALMNDYGELERISQSRHTTIPL